jgi:hypothetical protein
MRGQANMSREVIETITARVQSEPAYARAMVKKEQSNLWLEEHADFVKTYNENVAQEGLPLSEWTTF